MRKKWKSGGLEDKDCSAAAHFRRCYLAGAILAIFEPDLLKQFVTTGEIEDMKIGYELLLILAISLLVPLITTFLSLAERIIRNLKSYQKVFQLILLTSYMILLVFMSSYLRCDGFSFVTPTSYLPVLAPIVKRRNPFGRDFWVEELGVMVHVLLHTSG